MINRRGDEGNLLKETLEIILFVVGTAILIFAVWKVWDLVANQERVNADRLISDIVRRANDIEEKKVEGFTVSGLKNWYLVGWSKEDPANKKPDKCFLSSCICICKGDRQNTKKSCQEGICKELNFKKIKVYEFSNAKDFEMKVKEEDVIKDLNNEIYFEARPWSSASNNFILVSKCPPFNQNNLVKFNFYKNGDELNILKINTIDFSNLKFEAACLT